MNAKILIGVVFVLGLGLSWSIFNTAMSGIRVRKGVLHFDKHRIWTNRTLTFLVVLVLVIEGAVRLASPVLDQAYIFYVHLVFVVIFLPTFIAARFRYTGLKNKSWHRCLAYACCGSFVGVMATGVPLILLVDWGAL